MGSAADSEITRTARDQPGKMRQPSDKRPASEVMVGWRQGCGREGREDKKEAVKGADGEEIDKHAFLRHEPTLLASLLERESKALPTTRTEILSECLCQVH